jgi:hypothetical protein
LNADTLAQFVTLRLRIEIEDTHCALIGLAQPLASFHCRRFARAVRADNAEISPTCTSNETSSTAVMAPVFIQVFDDHGVLLLFESFLSWLLLHTV